MSRKKPLTPEQKKECDSLRRIWLAKKNELGLTYSTVGRIENISDAAVSHYVNAVNPLNPHIALTFSRVLGVPVSEFSPRLEKEILAMTQQSPSIVQMPKPSSRDGVVAIPCFSDGADETVRASMGRGAAAATGYVDVFNGVNVDKTWLRQNVNYTSPNNLAIITGYGDSMEGTFSDGDVLLVDRGVTEVSIDAVFVLALGDELYIKRLQRRPDGTILMISDNTKYPPYEIRNGDIDQFQVLGRVLLAWNARKL